MLNSPCYYGIKGPRSVYRMSILVLSDVHANLEALEAVLAHAAGFERVWFLGDAVGYGPDPNACVERLRELEPEYWLAGNHDWAALGKLDLDDFNDNARVAARWTSSQLTPDVRAFLDTLEPRIDLPGLGVTLVHGSPRHPTWEYILDTQLAYANFAEFDTPLCLFGHTHVPAIFVEHVDGASRRLWPEGVGVGQLDGDRWLVNPGSVGQPRDTDPRASYMLIEPETGKVTLHRVPYDVTAVQAKIRQAGLPERLAARLSYGW